MKKSIENNNRILFNTEGHLSPEGTAFVVDFLFGRKNEEEIPESLSKHLENCADCRMKVFNLHKALSNNKYHSLLKGKPILWKYITGLAAALIIFLLASQFLFERQLSNQQIFDHYFEPYPNMISIKGENHELLYKAMLYYDVGDYDSAIVLFDKVEIADNSFALSFYKGISYLATDEAEYSIPLFEGLTKNRNQFSEQAGWYYGLALLKSGKTSDAKQQFYFMVNNGGFYATRSKNILQEIQ